MFIPHFVIHCLSEENKLVLLVRLNGEELQFLTKLLEQNKVPESNYNPSLPWYSVETPNFVSRSLRSPTLRQGCRVGIMLCEKLQPCRHKFQCIIINKITALQSSNFQILFQLILSKIVVSL